VKGINIRNIPTIPIAIGTTLGISEKIEMLIPTMMKMNPNKITKSLARFGINILSNQFIQDYYLTTSLLKIFYVNLLFPFSNTSREISVLSPMGSVHKVFLLPHHGVISEVEENP